MMARYPDTDRLSDVLDHLEEASTQGRGQPEYSNRSPATWTGTPSLAQRRDRWLWIACAGVLGAAVVLAALRWRSLAWVGGRTRTRLRLRRVTAPSYAALLLVVTGLAVSTAV